MTDKDLRDRLIADGVCEDVWDEGDDRTPEQNRAFYRLLLGDEFVDSIPVVEDED